MDDHKEKIKEESRQRSKLWRATYPERHKENLRRWNKDNKEKVRATARVIKYGLSPKDFNILLVEQSNRCAIYQKLFSKVPYVDHNHKTGKIRGLLCITCNTGLGMFREDPKILRDALNYLEEKEEKHGRDMS